MNISISINVKQESKEVIRKIIQLMESCWGTEIEKSEECVKCTFDPIALKVFANGLERIYR